MANISHATGTITLSGIWDVQTIELFNTVIKNSWKSQPKPHWSQWYIEPRNYFSPDKLESKFEGCGRGDFSSTLMDRDRFTREYIEKGLLSNEIYVNLLKSMEEYNLSIKFEFVDQVEAERYQIVCLLTSEGGELLSEEVSSKVIEPEHDNYVDEVTKKVFCCISAECKVKVSDELSAIVSDAIKTWIVKSASKNLIREYLWEYDLEDLMNSPEDVDDDEEFLAEVQDFFCKYESELKPIVEKILLGK